MQRDELAAWLRLTLTPGVGNGAARRLLAAFGLPQNIFAQGERAWQSCVTTAMRAASSASGGNAPTARSSTCPTAAATGVGRPSSRATSSATPRSPAVMSIRFTS